MLSFTFFYFFFSLLNVVLYRLQGVGGIKYDGQFQLFFLLLLFFN